MGEGSLRSRQNILHKHLEVECQTVSTFSIFRYMTRAPGTEQDTGYTQRREVLVRSPAPVRRLECGDQRLGRTVAKLFL